MGCAVFAASSTKPKTTNLASQLSGGELDGDIGISQEELLRAVEATRLLGPSGKRKTEIDLGTPHF